MKVLIDDTPLKAWRPESKIPRALLEAAFTVLLPKLRPGMFQGPATGTVRIPAKDLRQFSTLPQPIHIRGESLLTEPVSMLAGRIAEPLEALAHSLNQFAPDGIQVLSIDLERPAGVGFAETMECGGVFLRVVQAYNLGTDQNEIRFDVLCAVVPIT